MTFIHRVRRAAIAMLTGAVFECGAVSTPIVIGVLTPAGAQISEDSQIALEQYGSWRPHPRFGEVWVPHGVPPDWRPYEYGQWSTPMNAAGIGFPTTSRRTGVGLSITTDIGHSNPELAGSDHERRMGAGLVELALRR
jgi:hypothetical protein